VLADEGYSPWCEQCGWNADPYPPKPPTTRAERSRAKARAAVDAAYGRFATSAVTRRDSAVRAYALALAVHAITLGVAGVTAWIAVASGFGVFVRVPLVILGALLTIDIAPRPHRAPKSTINRGQAPALWRLLDRIASEVGAPVPDAVVITNGVHRRYAVTGLRRRRVLVLGRLGWMTLSPAERVAALAHEIARGRERSCSDAGIVTGALHSLARWAGLLRLADVRQSASLRVGSGLRRGRMDSWAYRRSGGGALRLQGDAGTGLFNLITILPRWLIRPWVEALVRSAAVADQRSEAPADAASAKTASTAAAVALLERSYLDGIVDRWLDKASRDGRASPAELLDSLRALPPRQVARLRLAGRLRRSRVDDDHAATSARIEALLGRPACAPAVTLTDSDDAAILAELAAMSD
jgi:hypothetical protein